MQRERVALACAGVIATFSEFSECVLGPKKDSTVRLQDFWRFLALLKWNIFEIF